MPSRPKSDASIKITVSIPSAKDILQVFNTKDADQNDDINSKKKLC